MFFDISAQNSQQRPVQQGLADRPGNRHSFKPRHPAATKQPEQNRLYLIVRVVREQQQITFDQMLLKHVVPGFSGSGFKASLLTDGDTLTVHSKLVFLTQSNAELFVLIRSRMKLMINMDR